MPSSPLTPAQDCVLRGLLGGLEVGPIVSFNGSCGKGKTTILREVQRLRGGQLVNIRDLVQAMQGEHPMALEETFARIMFHALENNDLVLLDDLNLLECVVGGCSHFYPRSGYLDSPLTVIATYAEESRKKLVVASSRPIPEPIANRHYPWYIAKFTPEDYQVLATSLLGKKLSANLSFEKIHRFAPKLNCYQMVSACRWLKASCESLTTDEFMEYLRSQQMASNVHLGEVQQVDLSDLIGLDDLVAELEAHVIMPLENDQLASQLNLVAKRGVLIAGPPGTGKTTVGRALAHRLKSKFFLIDGTIISGTRDFYGQIHHIFEAAKENSPSIIFIDDSDVIFQSGEELGLYRYLLTILDGLESESASRVCLMLTAMDIGNLPPALIRSGRVELYLHTRLPDQKARATILRARLKTAPYLAGVDLSRLADACDGLTGADLKRVVEDAKLLYAYDQNKGLPGKGLEGYFDTAIQKVLEQKQHYAEAEARARIQRPNRSPAFDLMAMMGSVDASEFID